MGSFEMVIQRNKILINVVLYWKQFVIVVNVIIVKYDTWVPGKSSDGRYVPQFLGKFQKQFRNATIVFEDSRNATNFRDPSMILVLT